MYEFDMDSISETNVEKSDVELSVKVERLGSEMAENATLSNMISRTMQATANYFVSPNGSDTNDGSRYLPFKTIQKAMDVVVAGNSVCIFGGTYKEKLLCKTVGTIGSPIRFFANYGDEVIIDGIDRPYGETDAQLYVYGKHYNFFYGLTFKNSPTNGVEVYQANFVKFYNCKALDNNSTGFRIRGNDVELYDCESAYNFDKVTTGGLPDTGGDGDGFAISLTASYGLRTKFIRCKAHHNSDDGFDFWGGNETFAFGCISYNNGSQEGNRNRAAFAGTFIGDGNGIKYGAGISNDTNALIVNCLSYNNLQAGFHTNNGGNSRTYNCTAYGNTGVQISGTGLPRTDRNFFIYDASAGASRINTIKDCLSYGGVTISGSIYANNNWNLGIIVSDADFISMDPSSDDFLTLKTLSPCVGAGVNVGYGLDLGYKRQVREISIAK